MKNRPEEDPRAHFILDYLVLVDGDLWCNQSVKTPKRADEEDGAKENNETIRSATLETGAIDFVALPKVLDRAIELHDRNAAIRSTTIKASTFGWTRNRKPNLLTKTQTEVLDKDKISSERSKAFDLLGALSRSGSLDISFSELHVIVCATHRFEKNVVETVIEDNINPIEKLEMSTLLIASTIHNISPRELIRSRKDLDRLANSFPPPLPSNL